MAEAQMFAAQQKEVSQYTTGKKPGVAFAGIYWPTIIVIIFYVLVALGSILSGDWIGLVVATVVYLILGIIVQLVYPKHHTTGWILAFLPILIWVFLFLLLIVLGFVGITAALLR